MKETQIKKMGSGYELSQAQWIPRKPDEVFDFFSDPYNLEKITPDKLRFQVDNCEPEDIRKGTRIQYSLRIRGIPVSWESEIAEYEPPNYFVDRQISGPYKKWVHTHTFDEARGGSLIGDQVYYEMPMGFIGRMVHGLFVRGDLEEIFTYRSQRLAELLN